MIYWYDKKLKIASFAKISFVSDQINAVNNIALYLCVNVVSLCVLIFFHTFLFLTPFATFIQLNLIISTTFACLLLFPLRCLCVLCMVAFYCSHLLCLLFSFLLHDWLDYFPNINDLVFFYVFYFVSIFAPRFLCFCLVFATDKFKTVFI